MIKKYKNFWTKSLVFTIATLTGIIITFQSNAQTLEHTYPFVSGWCYKVADNEYVYCVSDGYNYCSLYTMNHVLIKMILMPPSTATQRTVYSVSKTLFNSDSKYEIVYIYLNGTAYALNVINEDGTVLLNELNTSWVTFKNTNTGAKMITSSPVTNSVRVYSLPGEIYLKVPDDEDNIIDLSVFPYPLNTNITIDSISK